MTHTLRVLARFPIWRQPDEIIKMLAAETPISVPSYPMELLHPDKDNQVEILLNLADGGSQFYSSKDKGICIAWENLPGYQVAM